MTGEHYMSMFDLTGMKALVTGGTSGIGFEITRALAEAGAGVIAVSENRAACQSTQTNLQQDGLAVTAMTCNLAYPAKVNALAEQLIDQFGGIDIIVCNAGIEGPVGPMGQTDEEAYRRLFDINLDSVVHLCGSLTPVMARRGGGAIVLMSSIAGLRGNRNIGSYALTKAALAQLARNLAVEWGSSNIRCNAISPGLIRTPFSEHLLDNKAFMDRRLRMTPLCRVGESAEIAATALFLASPAGAYISGQNIVVDGGTVITDGN